jgi:cyclopropane fatty-acyl-phospholipid synthase-like methyltransferase
MKLLHRLARKLRLWANRDIYRSLYESHAALHPAEAAVGDGDFDAIGRIELALLRQEGLLPQHTLIDFGCGSGRLAVHAIPYLAGGRYVGIDIAGRLIAAARKRVEGLTAQSPCDVSWRVQTTPAFNLPPASADFVCAISVFTHTEHEDTFNYHTAARRVVRPGGRFVLSCLPLDLAAAREEFRRQAALDFARRWAVVRNVTTSVELMSQIARLAGWDVVRWYAGDEANIHAGLTAPAALGQSSCVLAAPHGGGDRP